MRPDIIPVLFCKYFLAGQKRQWEIQFWVPQPANDINRGYGPPDFFPAHTLPSWNIDAVRCPTYDDDTQVFNLIAPYHLCVGSFWAM